MATIGYQDKAALYEESGIADINKVTDNDMNEIKQVVNENAAMTDTENNALVVNGTNAIYDDNGLIINGNIKINNTSIQLKNINNYSTNEVVIGTYNNKPLYQKMFSTTQTVNTDSPIIIPHNIANVEKIFIRQARFDATSTSAGGLSYNLPLIGYSGSFTDMAYANVTKTNITIYANGGWSDIWEKFIILNYTKTTD